MENNKRNIKIACSGGAGFIASNIIKHLNEEGYTNIDVYEKLNTLDKKLHNVFSLQINGIFDYKNLPEVANKYNWLLHLGADSSTRTKPEDYKRVLEQNHYYTVKLLEGFYGGLDPEDTADKKFIFASSASVYGNSNNFKERLDCVPQHIYGLSKLFCDRAIQDLINQEVRGLFSFRFYNCFGADESHKVERKMASPITRFLTEDPPFTLYRDEKNTEFQRDFIWVQDLADVIYFALTNDCKSGLYNLGSGKGTTWEELAKICAEVRGFATGELYKLFEYKPLPESLAKQYQAKTVADLTKLRGELGYKKEFTPLAEAIKRTWEEIQGK